MRRDSAPGSPRGTLDRKIEEAVMVIHWPKTIYGNLILFMLALVIAPILVWAAVSISGPLGLVSVAVVALPLACVAFFIRRRRVEAAREREWVGAFSFGDVIDRMRAREAGQVAAGN